MTDDSALIFIYVDGLKLAVKIQVLLERPRMIFEAELLAQRANMAMNTSGQHHYDGQPRHHHEQDY